MDASGFYGPRKQYLTSHIFCVFVHARCAVAEFWFLQACMEEVAEACLTLLSL